MTWQCSTSTALRTPEGSTTGWGCTTYSTAWATQSSPSTTGGLETQQAPPQMKIQWWRTLLLLSAGWRIGSWKTNPRLNSMSGVTPWAQGSDPLQWRDTLESWDLSRE